MTRNAPNEAPRGTARAAGFTSLFAIAIVVLANFGINLGLIVPGNAVDTARNIMVHVALFRLIMACQLIYAASIVALLAALSVT